MTGFYAEDLAYIHHQGFSQFVTGAAPGLLAELSKAGIASGLVVDLGCGGGVWLRELCKAGYEALGIEISPAFVALSRETAPEARLVESSLYEAAIPTCAAVTAISEVLCYRDGAESEAPLDDLFGRVFQALQPGGLFLFDLIVADPALDLPRQSWRAGADWAVMAELTEDRATGRLAREILLFRELSGGYRRSQERHFQRVFASAEIEQALRSCGFAVSSGRFYGAFELPPRRMAFRAQKPAG